MWYEYFYKEELLEQFMTNRSSAVLIVILVITIVILVKGANLLVEGAVALARRTGMPNIIIGATVVSLGTTMPECFVSVMGAFMGNPGLALGNGVGSIICDTGMIFGLVCILSPMKGDKFILNRQGWVQFGAAALLVALSLIMTYVFNKPVLGRSIGLLFLGLLVAYIIISIKWVRQHPTGISAEVDEIASHAKSVPVSLLEVATGLIMIVGSARVLIPAVAELALRMNVPEDIVAATLVAFGTSLPELVTCLVSVKKGHADLAIGNIIGADILNVLFVIGAASLAAPLEIAPTFFVFHFPAMLIILGLFRVFILINHDGRFKRWQGFILLTVYLIYIILQYALKMGYAH